MVKIKRKMKSMTKTKMKEGWSRPDSGGASRYTAGNNIHNDYLRDDNDDKDIDDNAVFFLMI